MSRAPSSALLPSIALVTVLASCVADDATERSELAIVDGRVAENDEARGLVAFVAGETRAIFCTGTHVAPGVVVTAAHCFDGHDPRDLDSAGAIVDALDALDPAQRLATIDGVELHPDYPAPISSDPATLGADNDVAVVRLSGMPADAATIPLLDEHAAIAIAAPGLDLVIAGYGQTADGSLERGTLHVGRTTLVRRTERELLAGESEGADTCFGDSGGPALVEIDGERRLLGVTARVSGTATERCGGGSIFTFAPAYASFVERAGRPTGVGCAIASGRADAPWLGASLLAAVWWWCRRRRAHGA